MSKFKVGDRVRLLSDAWSCARKESGAEPRFGRAGEVGVIVEDGGTSDGAEGWYVGEVGEFARGWFAEEQLEHADPQPPVAHHDRVVADTHAAIDRLVAHLERQATEHVHALDALRAEVESLRTQNAHLRALQAGEEAKNAHLRALQVAKEGEGKTAGNLDCVAGISNDSDALKVREPKPVREVVRGTYGKHHMKMLSDGNGVSGRHAIKWHPVNAGWVPYDGDSGELHVGLTEPEAIAWVLDGVLPAR